MMVWMEYFKELLNQKSVVGETVELSLRPQMKLQMAMDCAFTMSELELGLKQMSIRKATGVSGVPIEPILWGTNAQSKKVVLAIYNVIWHTGKVPQAFRDSIITVLHKGGDKRLCTNYRGLCLNEHVGKLLERMVLNRLLSVVCQVPDAIPDSQCGFVPGRSTMNASFMDRGLSSEYRSRGEELFKCYIDLTKAYDKVDRGLLWLILGRIGVPPKMLQVIKGLHVGARGKVRINGKTSEWFDLTVGLRQGAIFSPTLFNIFFGEIVRQMKIKFKEQGLQGAKIVFRRKGVVITGENFKEGDRNVETTMIYEALFADDMVLFAASAGELQSMIDIFDSIIRQFGQEISVKKTKVMIVRKPNRGRMDTQEHEARVFYVGGKPVEVVETFKYLGGLDTADAKMTEEIVVRKQRMQGAYAKYEKQIFNSALSERRKAALFNMVVVMNGLFGCQVWNVTQAHIDELEAVHSHLLRKMLNKNRLEWSRGDIIKYAEANKLNIFPIEWKMTKLQLRYVGHEVRVAPTQVSSSPHNMLFRGYAGCAVSRLPGRAEQAYPATIRRALDMCGLKDTRWVELAKNRKVWKEFIDKEASGAFLKRWYERENWRKEQRGVWEMNKEIREQRRVMELAHDMDDGRAEVSEDDGGFRMDDMGIDSDELLEEDSEEEDMGIVTPGFLSGRTVEWVPVVETVTGVEAERMNNMRVNQAASEVFISEIRDNYGLTENIEFVGITNDRIEEATGVGVRDGFFSKRKLQQREWRRQNRAKEFEDCQNEDRQIGTIGRVGKNDS